MKRVPDRTSDGSATGRRREVPEPWTSPADRPRVGARGARSLARPAGCARETGAGSTRASPAAETTTRGGPVRAATPAAAGGTRAGLEVGSDRRPGPVDGFGSALGFCPPEAVVEHSTRCAPTSFRRPRRGPRDPRPEPIPRLRRESRKQSGSYRSLGSAASPAAHEARGSREGTAWGGTVDRARRPGRVPARRRGARAPVSRLPLGGVLRPSSARCHGRPARPSGSVPSRAESRRWVHARLPRHGPTRSRTRPTHRGGASASRRPGSQPRGRSPDPAARADPRFPFAPHRESPRRHERVGRGANEPSLLTRSPTLGALGPDTIASTGST